MNLRDWILLALVLLAAVLAVRHIIRVRRQGGCAGCSGGCTGCSKSAQCKKQSKK